MKTVEVRARLGRLIAPAPYARLRQVRELAERLHLPLYLVGGLVRDLLLGQPPDDFDFVVEGDAPRLARAAAREWGGQVQAHAPFGTATWAAPDGVSLDIASARTETYPQAAALPHVQTPASLSADLARRDFTINAIAYHPLRHEWRDPFGGADDLARGVIRAVGEPDERFREDYLRVLRALRFAARFGFRIDPPTWAAACAAASGLARLSAERVRDEWFKGLRTARSVPHLVELWQDVGAAAVWLPGLGGTYSAAEADRAPRDPVLLTTLLVPDAPGALRRLRGSNAEIARADAMTRGPAAPAADTPEAARRWRSAVQGAADDLIALWRLRHGAEPEWAAGVAASRARGDPVSRADLVLDGNDLAPLGIPRGPRVGQVLDQLLDRVLADPSLNTKDQLAAIARTLA